jgi:hypothetical protein
MVIDLIKTPFIAETDIIYFLNMSQGLSLGRIQAGFAQASQELTVAAANLNFDFTLVKLEAPAEYQTIGHVLTPSRVREAETGPIHVTARRLGALFEGACPEAPNLIKAYGTRASEISKEVSESDSERSNGTSHNWIRNEYGGVDATSIWAAATSSKAALPVHLLACIIARMWSHTEATSVWVEIVAERKREIISKTEKGEHIPISLVCTVQQEITRDHLSKWDASARAWLQTADKARQRQYKQFLLIVKNLSIAIHQENIPLYSNVMSVWTSALIATEELISGKPQAVKRGPVLLGLSAWHIFPDMLVFDSPSGSVHVSMDDPLVKPGGVLSLGISDSARSEEQGVYWSLSLSHHRYYGDAVRRTRRLESDGSRLTFNELVLVCLGSLLKVWSIPKQGIKNSIEILQKLRETLPQQNPPDKREMDWQTVLEEPLKHIADGDKQAVLAISLGRRRPSFLPQSLTSETRPFFGLLHMSNLLYILKEPDNKISLLRRLASRVPELKASNSIILCAEKWSGTSHMNCQYATVFSRALKRTDRTNRNRRSRKFHRWIDVPPIFQRRYNEAVQTAMQDYNQVNEYYQLVGLSQANVDSFDKVLSRILAHPDMNQDISERPSPQDNQHDSLMNLRGGSGVAAMIETNNSDDDMTENTDDRKTVSPSIESGIPGPPASVEFESSNVRHDEADSPEETSDESVGDGPAEREESTFEGLIVETDWDDGRIDNDHDAALRQLTEYIDYQVAFPPEIEEERRALELHQEQRSAAQESFNDAHEHALRHLKELCSTYRTQRERQLPDETIEYLNRLDNEMPQWTYERSKDVVKSNSGPGHFIPFFGQASKADSSSARSLDDNPSDDYDYWHKPLGEHAMVYTKVEGRARARMMENKPSVTLEDLLWCFEHDLIDSARLQEVLTRQREFALLRVLAAVGEIYREPTSGGATISCSIINQPFNPPIFPKAVEKDWVTAMQQMEINENTAIALIGYFETGHNVMENMKGDYKIIGLSGGDSIFVWTAVGLPD